MCGWYRANHFDSKHVITIGDEDEIDLCGGLDDYTLTNVIGRVNAPAQQRAASDTGSVGSRGSGNVSGGSESGTVARMDTSEERRPVRSDSNPNGYGRANGKKFGGKKTQWRGYGHYVSITANRFDAGSLSRLRAEAGTNYFIRGQVEAGTSTRREHLQMFLFQRNKKRWEATRDWVDTIIGFKGNEIKFCEDALHAQRTAEYANKDHTGVPGTRWESGKAELPAFIKNGPGAPE